MKTSILLLIVSSTVLANPTEKFKVEAQKILKPIKKAFMKELRVGLKEGPYETIETCHLKAPHIAEGDFNKKYDVGRTSDKVRNLTNTPKAWIIDILNEYKKSNMQNPISAKVYNVKGKLAYVEPIYIKNVCLKCHGDLKGSVKKKIHTLYPKDLATGYKTGDFRGLFFIRQK